MMSACSAVAADGLHRPMVPPFFNGFGFIKVWELQCVMRQSKVGWLLNLHLLQEQKEILKSTFVHRAPHFFTMSNALK